MLRNVATILFYALLFYFTGKAEYSFAQEKDTLKIYRKIKKISGRYKLTELIYHSVFVDPAPEHYDVKPLSDEQTVEDPNLKYKGKIIKKISIHVFDPFGYSVNDTTRGVINPVQKIGNHYHIKTRRRIINNLLLFKRSDSLNPTAISESERLLRNARYINDARIYVTPADSSSDSVNVEVVVQDKWTVDAPFGVTPVSGQVTLRDRNLFGLGQSYGQHIGYNVETAEYNLSGNYTLENIKNSYISSSLYYTTTRSATQAGFSFDRPFYSGLARWAGGIAGNKNWGYYIKDDSTELIPKRYAVNSFNYDTWLAGSFNLPTGKKIYRPFSNLIMALRYAGTGYQDRPPPAIDTARVYSTSALYLTSIGFSLNKYYKDQFIYRFGANEDIPEGAVVQATFGFNAVEAVRQKYYCGFELSRGKHFNIGYLSAYAMSGTFFNTGIPNNTTLTTGLVYFTDLFKSRKWYFRQFAYYKFVDGVNKNAQERITFSSGELYGFSSGALTGTKKMLMNLETVMYTPYNIIGFRFAPVVLMGLGMIETDTRKLMQSQVYQGYSLGLLLRNEHLLTSSFQFTIGFYPNEPDHKNAFKMNPVTSFTLKVRSFAISKPGTIGYE